MSMRTGIEQWLLNIWYSRSVSPWYLRMLVPLYRAAYAFDHRKSNLSTSSGSDCVPPNGPDHVPVVVVGNITVGGSGKTPLVIALSHLASSMQLSVGIATTGYGRQSKASLQVHADSDPRMCGDEPVLMANRTNAKVVVARRRADAIKALEAMPVDVIFSDDGLQSPVLKSDLEICVIDGARGLGNGLLLPAGPLREPIERLQKVDCIVINGKKLSSKTEIQAVQVQGCRSLLPDGSHLMTLKGTMLHALNGSEAVSIADFFKQQEGKLVNVVAGIGNPERFFSSIRQLSSGPEPKERSAIDWCDHVFADHHDYQTSDFAAMNGSGAIVMTEKDAVKCRKLGLENAWYLPVDAALSTAFEDWFRQQLSQLNMGKS